MFEDRLHDICSKIEGAVAATLVDRDGITVESYAENGEIDREEWAQLKESDPCLRPASLS
jgi:hypothetical protein